MLTGNFMKKIDVSDIADNVDCILLNAGQMD